MSFFGSWYRKEKLTGCYNYLIYFAIPENIHTLDMQGFLVFTYPLPNLAC